MSSILKITLPDKLPVELIINHFMIRIVLLKKLNDTYKIYDVDYNKKSFSGPNTASDRHCIAVKHLSNKNFLSTVDESMKLKKNMLSKTR